MAATPAQGLRRHKCPQTLRASGQPDLTHLAVGRLRVAEYFLILSLVFLCLTLALSRVFVVDVEGF